MTNPLLQQATNDIIEQVTLRIAELKDKNFGPNEARMLEIYNKIVTVCLDREKNRPITSAYATLSDEELSSAFE